MYQEEETPRAGNNKSCEDRWDFSCASSSRSLPKLPAPAEVKDGPVENTSRSLRLANNIGSNSETKGRRDDDVTARGRCREDDYPQCRYLDTSNETESRSLSTATDVTEAASHFKFQNDSSRCRFVQVRHKNQRRLIALPIHDKTSSSASDSFRRRDDIANVLGAAFNVPCKYQVVGLIGPFFEDVRGKQAQENKETSVVLPLALLGHPDADFIGRCYNENAPEDEDIDRHDFELLLYPHPIQEQAYEHVLKPPGQTSEMSCVESKHAIEKTFNEIGEYCAQNDESGSTEDCKEKNAIDRYGQLGRFLVEFIGHQVSCNNFSLSQGHTLLRHLVLLPPKTREVGTSSTIINPNESCLPGEAYNVDVVFQGAYQVAKWIQDSVYLAEALKMISDNLSQEKNIDSSLRYDMSHADQGDMIDIAQVLLECKDIELPVYMALVDGILQKNQDLSRVYHEHLIRMEEEWWDTASESSGSKKSQSSCTEFEDNYKGRYSYFYQSIDKMMEDIRKLACYLKPIFPVPTDTSQMEMFAERRRTAEALDESSWSMEGIKIQEDQSIISNELIHAAATLVDKGRISLEAATILVSTFARESNPVVVAIYEYYVNHKDFSQFLNMLEWLTKEGRSLAISCADNAENNVAENHLKAQSIDEATVCNSKNDAVQSHLDLEYDVLFEEVSKWNDFGPLEIATLHICAGQRLPELTAALRAFNNASERGRMAFQRAIRKCVDQSMKRYLYERITAVKVDKELRMTPEPDDVSVLYTLYH